FVESSHATSAPIAQLTRIHRVMLNPLVGHLTPSRSLTSPPTVIFDSSSLSVRTAITSGQSMAAPPEKPRVLLADDHTLLLEAFQKLLADACDVVGTVSNGRDLVTAAAALHPDVIVVDVAMPLLNGLDAVRQIKRTQPDVRIIFLTMHEDPDL